MLWWITYFISLNRTPWLYYLVVDFWGPLKKACREDANRKQINERKFLINVLRLLRGLDPNDELRAFSLILCNTKQILEKRTITLWEMTSWFDSYHSTYTAGRVVGD